MDAKINPALWPKIYYLLLAGLVFQLGQEYYGQVTPFLEDGGDEGLMYFAANLAIVFYLGHKAFDLLKEKLERPLTAFFIILTPLFIIYSEVETYHEMSYRYIPFEKWRTFYQLGVTKFHESSKRNGPKISEYFQESIADIQDDPAKIYLVMKSQIYLAQLALLQIKNGPAGEGQIIKLIPTIKNLYESYPKGDTPELAMLAYSLGHLFNRIQQYDQSIIYISRCLDIYKSKPPSKKDEELVFNCHFEMIKFALNGEEGKSDLETALAHLKILVDTEFSLPDLVRKKDIRLLQILRLFMEKKTYDLCLSFYSDLLEKFRDSSDTDSLIEIYGQLVTIYQAQGQQLKAQIYQESKLKVEAQKQQTQQRQKKK